MQIYVQRSISDMRKTMFHYTSHIFTGDPSCSGKLKNFAQVIEGEIQNKSNYEIRRRELPLFALLLYK